MDIAHGLDGVAFTHRAGATMPNRLFVGNLPFHVTEDLLKQTFATAGEVASVSLVLDRQTGQSRGFAFIEMASPAAMQKAIDSLNGTDLGGRPLRVDVAEDRKPRGDGGGGGGGGRPHRRGGGGGGGGGGGRW